MSEETLFPLLKLLILKCQSNTLNLEWNMFHLKKPSLNMTKDISLNIFHIKNPKPIIKLLNISLKTLLIPILINMLIIFHKTESKKELNIKPSKNKSSTHQLKKKLSKLNNN